MKQKIDEAKCICTVRDETSRGVNGVVENAVISSRGVRKVNISSLYLISVFLKVYCLIHLHEQTL